MAEVKLNGNVEIFKKGNRIMLSERIQRTQTENRPKSLAEAVRQLIAEGMSFHEADQAAKRNWPELAREYAETLHPR